MPGHLLDRRCFLSPLWNRSHHPINQPGAPYISSSRGCATPTIATPGGWCRRAGGWLWPGITAAQSAGATGKAGSLHLEGFDAPDDHGDEKCFHATTDQNYKTAKGI